MAAETDAQRGDALRGKIRRQEPADLVQRRYAGRNPALCSSLVSSSCRKIKYKQQCNLNIIVSFMALSFSAPRNIFNNETIS